MVFKKDNGGMIIIDIGSKNIKLAQIRAKNGEEVFIENYAIASTPKGCFEDVGITNLEKIALTIGQLMKKNLIDEKKTSVVISNTDIVSKFMSIEMETKLNKDVEIRKRLEKLSTIIGPETHEIDYRIVDEKVVADKRQLNVLIIAVLKQRIQDYINILLKLDLVPVLIDIPVYSVDNFFKRRTKIINEKLYEQYGDIGIEKTFATIDLGANTTALNIFKENILAFNRMILRGGNYIDKLISQELFRDELEAENLKRKYGLSLPGAFTQKEKSTYSQAVYKGLEDVLKQIKASFKHYMDKCGGEKISHIYMYGGGSNLLGLREFLSEELKIPVIPTEFLQIDGLEVKKDLNTQKLNYLINCFGIIKKH